MIGDDYLFLDDLTIKEWTEIGSSDSRRYACPRFCDDAAQR